jgi:hypothetical protein
MPLRKGAGIHVVIPSMMAVGPSADERGGDGTEPIQCCGVGVVAVGLDGSGRRSRGARDRRVMVRCFANTNQVGIRPTL